MKLFTNKGNGAELYNSIMLLIFIYTIARVLILPYSSISIFILIVLPFLFFVVNKYFVVKGKYSSVLQDRGLIYSYLVIQIFVILRGLLFNYDSFSQVLTSSFTNPYGILALLIPFVVFLDPKQLDMNALVKIMELLLVVFLYEAISNYNSIFLEQYTIRAAVAGQESYNVLVGIVQFVTGFFLSSTFILYLPSYISKKLWLVALFCLCITIVIVMLGARRSSISYFFLIALSVIYYYRKLNLKISKIFYFIFIVGIVGIVYYAFEHMDSTFSLLQTRGLSNSRETVESEFWNDMGTGIDWLWGRGLNGTYYAASTNYIDPNLSVNRNIIETGYLNIILSGGVISLFMYVLIMLRAVKRGWYNSNNNLTKSFAIYIVVNVFALIPFGLLSFSLTFFIVWVGVAICNSPFLRSLSDNQIKQLLFM